MDAAYGVYGDCVRDSLMDHSLWEKVPSILFHASKKLTPRAQLKQSFVAVDDCIGHAIWLRYFLAIKGQQLL